VVRAGTSHSSRREAALTELCAASICPHTARVGCGDGVLDARASSGADSAAFPVGSSTSPGSSRYATGGAVEEALAAGCRRRRRSSSRATTDRRSSSAKRSRRTRRLLLGPLERGDHVSTRRRPHDSPELLGAHSAARWCSRNSHSRWLTVKTTKSAEEREWPSIMGRCSRR